MNVSDLSKETSANPPTKSTMNKGAILGKLPLTPIRFALPPILAIVAGKLLFEMLAFDFPQLGVYVTDYFSTMRDNVPVPTSLLESKGRLLWMTSVLLYLFVSAGLFFFLLSTLKKTASAFWGSLLVILLLASCEIIYLLCMDSATSPIKSLFNFTFDALAAAEMLTPVKLSMVRNTLELLNFLAITIAPLAIVTSCSVISQPPNSLKAFDWQYQWLKKLAEGASALMITGIIHMQLWLSWPLTLISEFTYIKELKEIIVTIIQYWGICYTLTIAALYLPLAVHLRNQARIYCDQVNPQSTDAQIPAWINDNAGLQSIGEKIPQIAAILAPMLVGSLSPAMTELFKY